jgi:hypothetical protein
MQTLRLDVEALEVTTFETEAKSQPEPEHAVTKTRPPACTGFTECQPTV